MKIWFMQKCFVKGFLPSTTGSFFLSFGPIYFHVLKTTYEMLCTIWYHLYKLKSEHLHGRVLLLVKLQAKSTYLKSTTPPWMFFTFFKLYINSTKSRNASPIISVVDLLVWLCLFFLLPTIKFTLLRKFSSKNFTLD